MRTFPRELAEFRRIVDDKGESLRFLSQEKLIALSKQPIESLKVD